MILHLEFKLVISHFVCIGTRGRFRFSSWKSVFLFRLLKLNEDEVPSVVLRRSADLIWRFLSTFRSYSLIEGLPFRHGTFKIPSEKIVFGKVCWKVSTCCIYYRWMIWFDGSCLSFVLSSDLRSSHFMFKRVHQIFQESSWKSMFLY